MIHKALDELHLKLSVSQQAGATTMQIAVNIVRLPQGHRKQNLENPNCVFLCRMGQINTKILADLIKYVDTVHVGVIGADQAWHVVSHSVPGGTSSANLCAVYWTEHRVNEVHSTAVHPSILVDSSSLVPCYFQRPLGILARRFRSFRIAEVHRFISIFFL